MKFLFPNLFLIFNILGTEYIPQKIIAQPIQTISFADALKRASSISIETNRARQNAKVLESDAEIAELQAKPKIQLTSNIATRLTGVAPRTALTTPAPTKIGTEYLVFDHSYGAQISTSLYDFGRLEATKKKIELQNITAKNQIDETLFGLQNKIAKLYFNASISINQLKFFESHFNLMTEKLKNMEKNYANGLRPETELLRVKLDLARSKLALHKAQAEVKLAKEQLKLSIFPPSEKPDSQQPQFEISAFPQRDINFWKKIIFDAPQFQSTPTETRRRAEQNANLSEIEILRTQKYPQINAILAHQWTGTMFPMTQQTSAQIQLIWEIPWTGQIEKNQEKILLKSEDFELQNTQDRRAFIEKTALAQLQGQINIEQLAETDQQIQEQARFVSLVSKTYENGRSSILEMSAAESDLIALKIEYGRLQKNLASTALDIIEAKGGAAYELFFK